jgi:hypothetical protein
MRNDRSTEHSVTYWPSRLFHKKQAPAILARDLDVLLTRKCVHVSMYVCMYVRLSVCPGLAWPGWQSCAGWQGLSAQGLLTGWLGHPGGWQSLHAQYASNNTEVHCACNAVLYCGRGPPVLSHPLGDRPEQHAQLALCGIVQESGCLHVDDAAI